MPALNCGPGSADVPANVAENRARVARHLGGSHPDVITVYQVHSGDAVVAWRARSIANARPKADAVVTAPRVWSSACSPPTARRSCSPTLKPGRRGGSCGLARGASAGVLEAAVAEMEKLGAARNRIVAAIGPCINQSFI